MIGLGSEGVNGNPAWQSARGLAGHMQGRPQPEFPPLPLRWPQQLARFRAWREYAAKMEALGGTGLTWPQWCWVKYAEAPQRVFAIQEGDR